jgi:Ala-tRNA(Pro) deacylase
MSMSARIESHLLDREVVYELIQHKPTGSTHESASAAHVRDHQVAKAVMVHDGAAQAMAVIPGDARLDLDTLSVHGGRRFRLDDETDLARLFPDCAPGAVPPLGPLYGIETYLDEALTTPEPVYFEAGDHMFLVCVSGEDFQRLLPDARRGHYGHRESAPLW